MNKKYIFRIEGTLIIAIIVYVFYGMYLMNIEDKYNDLAYFNSHVKNGDLIFKCSNSMDKNSTTEFNEYGIIEKSNNVVYVWDNQNIVKKKLFYWAKNGGCLMVFRSKTSHSGIKKISKKNGTYNHLVNSNKMEFIIENY